MVDNEKLLPVLCVVRMIEKGHEGTFWGVCKDMNYTVCAFVKTQFIIHFGFVHFTITNFYIK